MATYAGTAAVASVVGVSVGVVVAAAQITERLWFRVGVDRAELWLGVAEVAASGWGWDNAAAYNASCHAVALGFIWGWGACYCPLDFEK